MRKIVFATIMVIIIASVLMTTGCIRRDLTENSGPITEQTYDYTDFTGIDIGSAMKLEVTAGDTYSVKITASQNLFDRIKVEKAGDTLKINTEGWSFTWWWGQSTPRVTITMPVLKKLFLSGASQGTVTGFKSGNDLEVEASGASHVDMDIETGFFRAEASGASNVKGRLTATGSDITLSGASHLDLTGSGGDIRLEGSGASTASLRYFKVDDADIELTGASNGSLDVSGRLDVELSGASDLNYYGSPTLGDINISGASDLNHRE